MQKSLIVLTLRNHALRNYIAHHALFIFMTIWEKLLNSKNKDQVMNFEILPSSVLIKKLILKSPEGITATPERDNSSREMVDNEGTPHLKHVP